MNDRIAVRTSIFCIWCFLPFLLLGPALLGAQMLPEASKGFVPKTVYAIDYDAAWAKLNAALAANSISLVSAAKNTGQIETDFLEGSKANSHGAVIESHFKFTILVQRGATPGQTSIGITPLIEARSVRGNGNASPYKDVTQENAALGVKVRDWLYEKIEAALPPSALTVNGAPPAPAPAAPPADPAPKKSALSSFGKMLGKSFRTAMGGQMVWGYFDFPPGPNPQRYWCEMDIKTGEKQDPGVLGQLILYENGLPGVQATAVSPLSCGGMEKKGKVVTVGYASTARAADRVGLRNILPEFDEDQPVKNQWPHVAITILHSPEDWAKGTLAPESTGYLGCWTLKATVWKSATASSTIDAFQYCLPQDNGNEIKFGEGATWPTRSEGDIGYITGVKRTEGPAPPSNLFPGDHDTSSLAAAHGGERWNGFLAGREYYSSPVGLLLGTLRFQMGARDVANSHDLRVWIVSISQ